MSGKMQRAENIRQQPIPIIDQRPHQFIVITAVLPEVLDRSIQRMLQQHGSAVIERMRQRRRRLDPLQSIFSKVERTEKRGSNSQRMRGRTDIVNATAVGEIGRTHPAADRPVAFDQ